MSVWLLILFVGRCVCQYPWGRLPAYNLSTPEADRKVRVVPSLPTLDTKPASSVVTSPPPENGTPQDTLRSFGDPDAISNLQLLLNIGDLPDDVGAPVIPVFVERPYKKRVVEDSIEDLSSLKKVITSLLKIFPGDTEILFRTKKKGKGYKQNKFKQNSKYKPMNMKLKHKVFSSPKIAKSTTRKPKVYLPDSFFESDERIMLKPSREDDPIAVVDTDQLRHPPDDALLKSSCLHFATNFDELPNVIKKSCSAYYKEDANGKLVPYQQFEAPISVDQNPKEDRTIYSVTIPKNYIHEFFGKTPASKPEPTTSRPEMLKYGFMSVYPPESDKSAKTLTCQQCTDRDLARPECKFCAIAAHLTSETHQMEETSEACPMCQLAKELVEKKADPVIQNDDDNTVIALNDENCPMCQLLQVLNIRQKDVNPFAQTHIHLSAKSAEDCTVCNLIQSVPDDSEIESRDAQIVVDKGPKQNLDTCDVCLRLGHKSDDCEICRLANQVAKIPPHTHHRLASAENCPYCKLSNLLENREDSALVEPKYTKLANINDNHLLTLDQDDCPVCVLIQSLPLFQIFAPQRVESGKNQNVKTHYFNNKLNNEHIHNFKSMEVCPFCTPFAIKDDQKTNNPNWIKLNSLQQVSDFFKFAGKERDQGKIERKPPGKEKVIKKEILMMFRPVESRRQNVLHEDYPGMFRDFSKVALKNRWLRKAKYSMAHDKDT